MAPLTSIMLKGSSTYPGEKLSKLSSIHGLNVIWPSVALSISERAPKQVIVVLDGSVSSSLSPKGK